MNAPDGTGKAKKATLQSTAKKNAAKKAKTINKGKAKVVNSAKKAAKKAVGKKVGKDIKKGAKTVKSAAKKAAKKTVKKSTSKGKASSNKTKPKTSSKKATKKTNKKTNNKKTNNKKTNNKKTNNKKKTNKKTKKPTKKTQLKETKDTKTNKVAETEVSKAEDYSSSDDSTDALGKLSDGAFNSSQMSMLSGIIDRLKVNDLDSYVSSQLRNDYIRDRGVIQNLLDDATNKAFDVQRAQALRDAANAENTNYKNTQNAIAEMRRNLIGSASSGANVGAANATALQALLGLGQQNTDVTTEGLQNINSVARERSAQLAQNAVDAINTANDATSKMYDAATSAYGSDRSYAAQGAAEALGNIAATAMTNRTNYLMNQDTNQTSKDVATIQGKYGVKEAKTTGKYNVKTAKVKQKSKNVNINYSK